MTLTTNYNGSGHIWRLVRRVGPLSCDRKKRKNEVLARTWVNLGLQPICRLAPRGTRISQGASNGCHADTETKRETADGSANG